MTHTESKLMAELKTQVSNRDDRITELLQALQWCGGSSDFAPGGKAHKGWKAAVLPLLNKQA